MLSLLTFILEPRGGRLSALSEALKEAEKKLSEELVATPGHVRRVLFWCEKIAREEGADLEAVKLAAALHDIAVPEDRAMHYELGAKVALEALTKLGVPREVAEKAAHAIRAHSRYGGPDPETLEDKVLWDADCIDACGAIGVIRAVLRELQASRLREPKDIIPALEKIASLKAYTRAGREELERRRSFILKFIEELKRELAASGEQL
ncbi:MAG: phosphohydrolase [Thermoproteota archaeon]|nr:MAG: phosphohydrolase [Candidatus Korarchaeota archaeon]